MVDGRVRAEVFRGRLQTHIDRELTLKQSHYRTEEGWPYPRTQSINDLAGKWTGPSS